MSLLTACNEASPGVSYFAPASGGGGGGGGSTLQSPASITPAVDGTASFSVLATGAALASVEIGPGTQSGQSSSLTLRNGAPGTSLIQMDAVAITQNGFSGAITVSNVNTSVTPFSVDTTNNTVGIGSAGGTVSVGAPMTVNAPTTITNGTNGISLTATSGTVSNIGQTVASGGVLVLGSSVAQPQIISISDTGASVTGTLSTTGTATVPDLVVNGTALISGTATVDDIVLTGASSAIQVPGQGGSGQPPIGITMSLSRTLIGNPELSGSLAGVYNGGIVGQASYNFVINSTGQPAGVIGNTGAQVGGPAALSDISCEGLWIVSLVVSNASTDIYSKLAQIRTVSYWNPVTGWFGGSGGACTLGGAEFRAGINPSNVIAPGQLWVTNTSGNNWTGMSVNLTQITGTISGYFVA